MPTLFAWLLSLLALTKQSLFQLESHLHKCQLEEIILQKIDWQQTCLSTIHLHACPSPIAALSVTHLLSLFTSFESLLWWRERDKEKRCFEGWLREGTEGGEGGREVKRESKGKRGAFCFWFTRFAEERKVGFCCLGREQEGGHFF